MGELRVNDAVPRKMVVASNDLAGVVHGINNDDTIRESNNSVVNGGLGAAAEKAMGYFEEAVGIYVKRLETCPKVTKEAAEDFASTDQASASSSFSTQQKLVQMDGRPRTAA